MYACVYVVCGYVCMYVWWFFTSVGTVDYPLVRELNHGMCVCTCIRKQLFCLSPVTHTHTRVQYVCILTHTHTRVQTHTHIHVSSMYIYSHTHTRAQHVCVLTHTYTCPDVCILTHTYACPACMCTHTHTYTCPACMYTHAHILGAWFYSTLRTSRERPHTYTHT